jgi:transcription-repair coupling factor (superfamily II helicase)
MSDFPLTSAFKGNKKHIHVSGVETHHMGFLSYEILKHSHKNIVLILKDAAAIEHAKEELKYFAPKSTILTFPAWDVQPYDRTSPHLNIQSKRLETLSQLKDAKHAVILTTVNALSTRTAPNIPQKTILNCGESVDRDALIKNLVAQGYIRTDIVMEPGEFTVRGGLMDIYPATESAPVRLDFFDDEIEHIKTFDPATQRTDKSLPKVVLSPSSELTIDAEKVKTFRRKYRELFPEGANDAIYRDISESRTNSVQDHFLPLFFEEGMASFFDYLPENTLFICHDSVQESISARLVNIEESYSSRLTLLEDVSDWQKDDIYRPIPSELLYFTEEEWQKAQTHHQWIYLEPFEGKNTVQFPYTPLLTEGKSKLDSAIQIIKNARTKGDKIFVSAISPSSLAKIENTLVHHGMDNITITKTWSTALNSKGINLGVSPIGWGFYNEAENYLIVTEQDMFGEKNTFSWRKKRNPDEIISHFSELTPGDYVVHYDHGISRFEGLKTIESGGITQDFVELTYADDDKLFVPIINLDVLSRYKGGEGNAVGLDKIGGAGWQKRKARAKKNLLEIAGELIKIAAKRQTAKGHVYSKPDGLYDAFCAGFPFTPTPEQQKAFDEIEDEMLSSSPMDRLVVGDVGFGKTEVALRAAFIAAADGMQVAVVVPTTLLARQHYLEFKRRFKDFPIQVSMLSRLVTGKAAKEVKDGLAKGKVDIVIGTHSLLADSIHFKKLGLLIIDEEQHFGVKHKEKIKKLKNEVDVLTLTATPIPRTLNMSLSGLKTLSLITTPPVDRLAVHTYVMPFDKKVIREAITREIFRKGQVFFITPRVEGIEKLTDELQALVPETKVRFAHGQMPKTALERLMEDFYDGKFNVLVSTTIVESGLDIPTANTIIVHRSDRFGLGQLHQLRGRVGRSNIRAYSYFLLPENNRTISQDAEKRLRVLQRLEGLGSGFKLASHDMDIRGAGNILGEQQSGQIKEVGFELYNQMLKEAIHQLKHGEQPVKETFTPNINLGVSLVLPKNYITDDNTRMVLYRRLSHVSSEEEIQEFKDELMDRFGPIPHEVEGLLQVVSLRKKCADLNISRLEAGKKGVTITFHNNTFAKPKELLEHIMNHAGIMSFSPYQQVVVRKNWPDAQSRILGIEKTISQLEMLKAG